MEELKKLERFWTGSDISVRDHIEYLDAIHALKFEDGMARIATVAA